MAALAASRLGGGAGCGAKAVEGRGCEQPVVVEAEPVRAQLDSGAQVGVPLGIGEVLADAVGDPAAARAGLWWMDEELDVGSRVPTPDHLGCGPFVASPPTWSWKERSQF